MNIVQTSNDSVTLIHGNSLEVLKELDDGSVDSVVTDPPYEIGFMSRNWDSSGIAYSVELWKECLRVLKPGGYLLSFGATRTYHRMACAIEDAGFEIRDSIHYTYGTGFPKSHNVSKAIDKAAGAEREVIGRGYSAIANKNERGRYTIGASKAVEFDITAPATPAAEQWAGWGTALKPSHEPIVVARKPLTGTVAENVLAYGTGALNIDGTRVGSDVLPAEVSGNSALMGGLTQTSKTGGAVTPERTGRWPANTILTHSAECQRVGEQTDERAQHGRTQNFGGGAGTYEAGEAASTPKKKSTTAVYECVEGCPVVALDKQSGKSKSGKNRKERGTGGIWSEGNGVPCGPQHGDSGGASRFFQNVEWDADTDNLDHLLYYAKAGKKERPVVNGVAHATVKPLALMRYLVRMVTPPGGVVLEPFTGSGTTVEAAILEGFDCVAIELEEPHIPLIQARIDRSTPDVDELSA